MAVDRMLKACHRCRLYIELGSSYQQMQKEKDFDRQHRGHPTQVVRASEVQEHYKKIE